MTTEHNTGPGDPGRITADIAAIEGDEERLARDTERLERDLEEQHRHVDVQVNNNPVRLNARRETGLQIKDAAIEQGVQIDRGFQLWEELGEGRERQVGDTDEITVHEGARFTAIAPDDNS
ncbi:multiubiquitin domain-containing protein [Jatrophihabitans lederbergiae]|uniref:Multiubiquitin domain-containing protein n=1 Tax=Jatrophihabitans lederbergiae TaxID=3075547 RepID=A0ABU2JHI3_9ACTN|nr:multiubiquitin domain-containing protein [Jatrophihabitans sp. DSM 44399]MDT0264193.1 multiubiquitin domain-containing protein [Jatrophihabitans sp. DSM 44399]